MIIEYETLCDFRYSKLIKSILGTECRYFIESFEYDDSTHSGKFWLLSALELCLTDAQHFTYFCVVYRCL